VELEKALRDFRQTCVGAYRHHFRFTAPPIILGGCGRSGTTLALSLLSSHPDIFAIPYETKVFCPGAYDEASAPRAQRELSIRKIFPHLARSSPRPHASRWCEKTPKNVLFFEEILALFSRRVKIIHLVRDGRDVVLSKHPLRPDAYWVSAERWVKEVQAGLRFSKDPNVLTVRYEDLILDPAVTIPKVEDFLELEHRISADNWVESATVRNADSLFAPIGPIQSASIGKWKRAADTDARIETFLNTPNVSTLMSQLGYG